MCATVTRTIRHSRKEDLPRLLEVYAQAREIMRSDGNMHQWEGCRPTREQILKDIAAGVGYVIEEDGRIDGAFAFIPGKDPTYSYIEGGKWLDDNRPYATIHRLGSTKDSHGIARACFEWAWEQIPNLRVDTHSDNRIMQHCVAKAGFEYCGIIYLENGDPRLAYQKVQVQALAALDSK